MSELDLGSGDNKWMVDSAGTINWKLKVVMHPCNLSYSGDCGKKHKSSRPSLNQIKILYQNKYF